MNNRTLEKGAAPVKEKQKQIPRRRALLGRDPFLGMTAFIVGCGAKMHSSEGTRTLENLLERAKAPDVHDLRAKRVRHAPKGRRDRLEAGATKHSKEMRGPSLEEALRMTRGPWVRRLFRSIILVDCFDRACLPLRPCLPRALRQECRSSRNSLRGTRIRK